TLDSAGGVNIPGYAKIGTVNTTQVNATNITDYGPATNTPLVTQATAEGPTITSMPTAPGNGYIPESTNTGVGMAWFPAPTPGFRPVLRRGIFISEAAQESHRRKR